MAVELMGFPTTKLDQQKAIQEAASEGLKGMEHLIRTLSHQPTQLNTHLTDLTVSKFKKFISLLNRTGHARFRRAPLHPVHQIPSQPQPSNTSPPPPPPPPPQFASPAPIAVNHAPASFVPTQPQSLTLDFTKPNNILSSKSMELEFSKETFSVSSNSSFMSSAITGDGSVSNGKQGSSAIFGGKTPLLSAAQPSKKRCHDHRENSDDVTGSSKCHCIKRRYTTQHRIVSPHFSIFFVDSYLSKT